MKRATESMAGEEGRGASRRAIWVAGIAISLILVVLSLNVSLWVSLGRFREQVEAELDEHLLSVASVGASLYWLNKQQIALLERGVYGEDFKQKVGDTLGELRDIAGVEAIWLRDREGEILAFSSERPLTDPGSPPAILGEQDLSKLRACEDLFGPVEVREDDGYLYKSVQLAVKGPEGTVAGILGVEDRAQVAPVVSLLRDLKQRLIYAGAAGVLLAIVLTCFSIRAVLRALVRLRRSLGRITRYHDYILENMGPGLVTVGRGGRVTTYNRAAEEMLGIPRNAALSLDWDEALGKHPELVDNLGSAVRGETSGAGHEVEVKTENGTRFLELDFSQLEESDGKRMGTVIFMSDITRMKHLRQQAQMEEKLAALGQLAAGVAHEIRNPLESIQLFTELLGKKVEGRDKEMTVSILREVQNMEKVVSEFLNFARPAPPSFGITEMQEIVESSLFLVSTQLERQHVGVVREYRANGASVRADVNQMKQVFLNIFLNGLQVMPKRGEFMVSIHTTGNAGSGEEGGAEGSSRWVQTVITNNGPPIPVSDIQRIFDPFYTTKEKGTGMGLAVAHSIIKSHRGTIRVEGSPSGGARFVIELPEFKPQGKGSDAQRGEGMYPGGERGKTSGGH